LPTVEAVIPRPIPDRDANWRKIELDPPLFDSRARYYLEARIKSHKAVADVCANSRFLLVKLNHAVHWDHLPSIRWFITEQIGEIRASGR
jgi:hypothetical protein